MCLDGSPALPPELSIDSAANTSSTAERGLVRLPAAPFVVAFAPSFVSTIAGGLGLCVLRRLLHYSDSRMGVGDGKYLEAGHKINKNKRAVSRLFRGAPPS